MRNLLIGGTVALMTGCATPQVTYERVSAVGNTSGEAVFSLPVSRVAIASKAGARAAAPAARIAQGGGQSGGGQGRGAGAGGDREGEGGGEASTPNFSVSFHANADATFVATPHRSFLSLTRLAPSYRADSAIISNLGVQTIDRSAEVAEDVVSIASAFGGDLTGLSAAGDATIRIPAGSITCLYIEPEFIAALLDHTARTDYNGETPSTPPSMAEQLPYPATWANETQEHYRARIGRASPLATYSPRDCKIDVYLDRAPADAVTLRYFLDELVGEETGLMVSASCRRMTIDFTAAGLVSRWVGYVADPFFVRVTRLPYAGELDATNVCSPPSLEQGDAPTSALHSFRTFLDPFRNDGGGGEDGGAGGDNGGQGRGNGGNRD